MRKYLSTLPYKRNGYRMLDVILLACRKIIQGSLYFSIAMVVLTILGIVFRIQVPDIVFLILFGLLIFNNIVALYFGVWHTRLASRQRFELFEEVEAFPRNKRVAVMKKFIT